MLTRGAIRVALLSLALLFLVWEAYGAAQWVSHAGGVGPALRHFWTLLHGDWILLVVVTDLLLIAGVVLAGLWIDAARRGFTLPRRMLVAVAFIVFGSPVLLWYLASRIGDPASRGAAASPPGDA
ncbi:MAG TPA: hypothetical protein VFT04_13095 [Gemmatimonadales bacterium]|nr:hypothetical protein [Gemmatimonadales bacterium]